MEMDLFAQFCLQIAGIYIYIHNMYIYIFYIIIYIIIIILLLLLLCIYTLYVHYIDPLHCNETRIGGAWKDGIPRLLY